MTKSRLIALFALLITISIVLYPDAAFKASFDGLKLWFEIVLPALLPFFAMADLLMGLGVVHAIGSLLEPVMRPIFRIPGVGGFAVAMGLAGGYPIGARITGDLYRRKMCTRVEAERLLNFSNTADPLFIIGAVAVGMFASPELGIALIMAHYLGALVVGFLMRYYRVSDPSTHDPNKKGSSGYFARALKELDRAYREDGRSFGQLFGETVRDTFAAMLFIGGCIMIFSVLTAVLNASGIMGYITIIIGKLVALVGLDISLTPAIINGIFETTLGAQTASQTHALLSHQAIVASLVIGWSGLSVHTQVMAMIQGTDIRMMPYLWARIGHGVVAAIFTAVFLGPASNVTGMITGAIPVFASDYVTTLTFGARLASSSYWAGMIGLGCSALGGVAWMLRRVIYIPWKRPR